VARRLPRKTSIAWAIDPTVRERQASRHQMLENHPCSRHSRVRPAPTARRGLSTPEKNRLTSMDAYASAPYFSSRPSACARKRFEKVRVFALGEIDQGCRRQTGSSVRLTPPIASALVFGFRQPLGFGVGGPCRTACRWSRPCASPSRRGQGRRQWIETKQRPPTGCVRHGPDRRAAQRLSSIRVITTR